MMYRRQLDKAVKLIEPEAEQSRSSGLGETKVSCVNQKTCWLTTVLEDRVQVSVIPETVFLTQQVGCSTSAEIF